ncbi:thioredoxin family protein [Gemmata sp. JC673]|uniref:Thioredoxin family protein n=1 Tax=Gemmata algarum TaxID=2975278 RepID=A0ABU5EWF8_9BACT|nr:thioredoxin family protein [Gemmata algarum]MDY3559460.1 thioredoxin family protein [Gemmata algarum]
MNLFTKFEAGLPLAQFLAKHGTDAHRARWQAATAQTALTGAQQELVRAFTRRTNVLVLAGAWCGDCSSQCPIFERVAEINPNVVVRYIDRDEHADAQAALQINGGNRVPVAVFFSEDGHEVARYGERTLARYRALVAQLTGEGCATGFVKGDDPVQKAVVQEWLDQLERVQCILRLSPRLRAKHGD